MPLQGKLSIGFLTEDNPYKSFFVFKPLFIKEGDVYRPFEEAEKVYPEDGAIRIVPDKNEMNTFKARMRKIGALCMMDLRRYPSENNKIRPNKNYSRELGERNQYIVYSDVLTPLSPAEFAEVFDAPETNAEGEAARFQKTPIVENVALRREGMLTGPYFPEALETGETALRIAEDARAFSVSEKEAEGRLIRIRLLDDSERLLLGGLAGADAPVAPQDFHSSDEASDRPAEIEKESAKPWITRDERIAPARGFANTREQFIAAQSGLNPRRGRSLSEVVDDQWRKSRIDQLGHPIPAQAGRPAVSPIDRAMEALLEAWRYREARPGLLNHLVGVPDLREALKEYFYGGAKDGETAAFEAALNEFEASRLKLAMEIDELRAQREALYEKLMAEVRARNASEVSALEGQKDRLTAEIEKLSAEAKALENRAQSADRALQSLFGEQFDEKIAAKIFEDRTLTRLSRGDDAKRIIKAAPPAITEIDKDALADRADAHFKRAGFFLPRQEIMNLLILTAIGDPVVLSGPPGAGHGALAETLSAALGARASFQRMSSAGQPDAADVNGAPAIIQIDGVNGPRGAEKTAAALSTARWGKDQGVRVFAVADDAPDGHALSQELLCGAYFVRLRPPPVDAPWGGYESPAETDAISVGALVNAFKPAQELPAQIEIKLSEIRASLAGAGYRMGREMLSGLWRYCAAGAMHLGLSPVEVLDFALAQRALPAIMATMEPRVLRALPAIFSDLKRCKALMNEPIPVYWD